MPQPLSKLYVHLICSTPRWEPLRRPSVRGSRHAYWATGLKNQDGPAVKIGGTSDHAHRLFRLSKNLALADVFGESEDQFLEGAQNPSQNARVVLLAERLWRLFREPGGGGCGGRVYGRAGRTT